MEELQERAAELWKQLVEECQKSDWVLGLILSGSRGKGLINAFSDYDGMLIVDEKDLPLAKNLLQSYHSNPLLVDLGSVSIQKMREDLKEGPPNHWAKYAYSYLAATVDKTGEIQQIIDTHGKLPEDEFVNNSIRGNYDFAVNAIYRAIKCHRSGDHLGGKLEITRGIAGILTVVFYWHGRRFPYYKYLEWEVKTHGLDKLKGLQEPMEGMEFIGLIAALASDDYVPATLRSYRLLNEIMIDTGNKDSIYEWDEPSRSTITEYSV